MKGFLTTTLALSLSTGAMAIQTNFISVDKELGRELQEKFYLGAPISESVDGVVAFELNSARLPMISDYIHEEKHRCGGFMAHDSAEQAIEAVQGMDERSLAQLGFLHAEDLTEDTTVKNYMGQVAETEIRTTILGLSSFFNRYYNSKTGVDSQQWLKGQWEVLGQGRNDFKVDFYRHAKWSQPSVVATLEGTDLKDEIIIIGGHADSIGRGFFDRSQAQAPGADDNASGIATITEAIRILMSNGFKPRRTIMFMGYAAEEVGLLGSKEIATQFKREGKKVINVMQFDMANYKGGPKSIYLSTDYTGAGLGEFMGKLIDQYVQVPWGTMSCGYACSDHASWTNQGYPAILATEAPVNQMNKSIHTEADTLDKSGGNAEKVTSFAKLAVAFAVESAKSSGLY